MKPGEKIRLIEECHEILMQREGGKLLLVLRAYGFDPFNRDPWYPDDDSTYVLEVLEKGPEDKLLEMHGFLRGEDAAPSHRDDDQPWGDLPVRVFLSHIHDQRVLVSEVKEVLATSYSIDAFVAHDDIHVSKKWREVIKAGLATCDLFVAFLDDGYHESQWCDQEAGWALARNVPIITVRPEGVGRHDGFLEEHQDLNIASQPDSPARLIARQIFITVVVDARTRDVGTQALVETFVRSWSFDTTRFLWPMLERRGNLTRDQLRRIEYAVGTNRQVYQAVDKAGTSIPELVKALVEKLDPPQPPILLDEPPF